VIVDQSRVEGGKNEHVIIWPGGMGLVLGLFISGGRGGISSQVVVWQKGGLWYK